MNPTFHPGGARTRPARWMSTRVFGDYSWEGRDCWWVYCSTDPRDGMDG